MLKLFLIFLSSLIINSLATDFVAVAIDTWYILEIEPIINHQNRKNMKTIIEKLKQDIKYSLSTKDFETLGFSFESFLRYGQQKDQEKIKAFHQVLVNKFDK